MHNCFYLSKGYKSVYPTVLDLVRHICTMKRAGWNPKLVEKQWHANPVAMKTMGSGGSSYAASAQAPNIRKLSSHKDNVGSVLDLTDGQDIIRVRSAMRNHTKKCNGTSQVW